MDLTNIEKKEIIKCFTTVIALQKEFPDYLCIAIRDISTVALGYFKSQKPSETLHTDFYTHYAYHNAYVWWRVTADGNKQRILFLEHLIKQLNS